MKNSNFFRIYFDVNAVSEKEELLPAVKGATLGYFNGYAPLLFNNKNNHKFPSSFAGIAFDRSFFGSYSSHSSFFMCSFSFLLSFYLLLLHL